MPEVLSQVHYTAAELAKLWRLHPTTVMGMFADEPGVLKIGRVNSARKRSYVTLRIPESVAARFYQAHSK
jgi:hypothetical protein